MKKILFIVNTLSSGGAERCVSYLSKSLSGEYEIEILLNSDIITYPFSGKVMTLGMDSSGDRNSGIYQLRALIRKIRTLRKLRSRNRYSYVISFSDSANIANLLTKDSYSESIITVRNSFEKLKYKREMNYLLPLEKRLYSKADCCVAVSEGTKKEAERFFGLDIISVIENGTDPDFIEEKASEALTESEERMYFGNTLIAMGRLTEQKGFRYLLRAFSSLKNKEVSLIIIGEGKEEKELKDLSVRLGVDDRVFFTGFTDNPYKYIKRADIFLCSSLYEGYSNALLEALTLGKPVISTAHISGAEDILSPGKVTVFTDSGFAEAEYGILTPVFNEDADRAVREVRIFAETINTLLNDKNRRDYYSKKALKRSRELNIDNITKKWRNILK